MVIERLASFLEKCANKGFSIGSLKSELNRGEKKKVKLYCKFARVKFQFGLRQHTYANFKWLYLTHLKSKFGQICIHFEDLEV
jgi:hypothetical protein